MLKDLEKRSSAGAPSTTGLPPQVTSVSGARRYRKALWGGMSLLLAGVGVAWFVWAQSPDTAVRSSDETMTAQPDGSGAATALSAMVRLAEEIQTPVADDKIPATLEMLRLEQQAERLQVEIDFSTAPAYGLVRQEQGRQLVLNLPGGVMTAVLPNTAELPLLRSVASQERDTGVQLVFSFHQGCRYEELALIENPAGRGQTLRFVVEPEPAVPQPVAMPSSPDIDTLQGRVADTPRKVNAPQPAPVAASAKPEQSLVRQEVQTAPRVRAANYFRDGNTALHQGRLPAAENAWRAALALDPELVEARDVLLRLLSRQNRRADTRILLAEGVRATPQHLPYRLQYARLLIEAGALSEAREQLTREPRPPVAQAPDLYAMLATVYQRQAHYAEAAHTYRALLAVKPDQALWWMGLGIALEGDSLQDQAQHAYRQAISRGGLSSGLQTYIRQRLAVLGTRDVQGPAAAMSAGKDQS
jgi:MSHA biogenesis protein MshN